MLTKKEELKFAFLYPKPRLEKAEITMLTKDELKEEINCCSYCGVFITKLRESHIELYTKLEKAEAELADAENYAKALSVCIRLIREKPEIEEEDNPRRCPSCESCNWSPDCIHLREGMTYI